MTSFTILAPAKINLSLRILRRRPDGYHDLETVFQKLDWGDEISLAVAESDSLTVTDNPWDIGSAENNLAWRALRALRGEVPDFPGVAITLGKNIPPGAGLGGGSSDAAAVLVGVNELLDLKLSQEKLQQLGRELGADVPFLVSPWPCAIGRGVGEKLEPVAHNLQPAVTLLYPGEPSPTKEAFEAWHQWPPDVDSPTLESVVQALKTGDFGALCETVHNDFTRGLEVRFSFIKQAVLILKNLDGVHAVWPTGSGSTVVALSEAPVENLPSLSSPRALTKAASFLPL